MIELEGFAFWVRCDECVCQTPLPPKHSTNASSVSVALQSLRDKVNAQGEIGYTMISKSAVDGSVVEDHYTSRLHMPWPILTLVLWN
jgi:hypothetical protein